MFLEKDMPPDLKRALRMGLGNNNGVSGLFEQDDMDNWRGVTQASLSPWPASIRRRSPWVSVTPVPMPTSSGW